MKWEEIDGFALREKRLSFRYSFGLHLLGTVSAHGN